jgi:hypothetical protein
MKSIIKYFIFFTWFVFFFGCDDPQPTSLVEDEDLIAIEVITKNPAEPTSFGVDSTGIDENPARFTNVVTVAGIKQTFQGISFRSSFAQAAFFDKTKPVYGFRGKLLGYSTLTPGSIFFNNQKAQLRQFTVKHGVNRDTSLGLRYVLHRRGVLGDPFEFNFNSKINFRFEPFLSPAVSFDIVTPPEIFLTSRLVGRKANKNLDLLLEWNAAYVNNFEILISIVDDQRDIVFPLYKIKTADDGKFVMPKKLLQELAVRYNKIAFTLTRKYEKQHNSGVSELFVVSQSINSISVELP